MNFYHGIPSPSNMKAIKEACPSHTHGACWTPQSMGTHDWPYIIDNGAYNAFQKNEPWDVDGFVKRLNQIETKMPTDPDFIVLPDKVTNPRETYRRSEIWVKRIDYPTVFACQDGMGVEKAIDFALEYDCKGLFIGGSVEWKRRNAKAFVEAAHGHDLWVHIGRPTDLTWAKETGADSLDTTSIVRNRNWERLQQFEEQTTLV